MARPDLAELDVFLGQLLLYLLDILYNILIQKCNRDHLPTPKPNLTHE